MGSQYTGGTPETYLLPLAFAAGDRAFELRQTNAQSVIAQLKITGKDLETEGVLYDALYEPGFCKGLLASIARGRRFKGDNAEIRTRPRCFTRWRATWRLPGAFHAERRASNTSIVYGDRLILKFFRRVGEGLNPDVEVGQFITDKTSFANVPVWRVLSRSASSRPNQHTRNSPGTGRKSGRCVALYTG